MNQKQRLEEQFNRIRQATIDNNEPTAIVLAENFYRGVSQLTIESFSVKNELAEQGIEWAIQHAGEEARCYGKPVWVIDLIGEPFASEPDAFELAWQNREYYYESRAEAEAV